MILLDDSYDFVIFATALEEDYNSNKEYYGD
jgi:hypothetical protein